MGAKQFKGVEYLDFQRAWYMQQSSARMLNAGLRPNCSDAVDATGRYIWRENGLKNGRCCGIDFQQAAQKRHAGKCNGDPVCSSAAISTYVAFAYDAAIAMAHGLDSLLRKGVSPDKITANQLSKAMRHSAFKGVSGNVSFDQNGDRQVTALEYTVYNYNGQTRAFQDVGQMRNDAFAPCEGVGCSQMVFSNGKNTTNVHRFVRDTVHG